MFKNFGYYLFFFLLILIFGVSGISDVLNSKVVYIASGTVIAISLCLAVWVTFTRKTFKAMADIEAKTEGTKLKPAKPKAKSKPKAKTKVARKVKK